MATLEPAAPWNDGAACRKQRAPRIGDLPRHTALDVESRTPQESLERSFNSKNTSVIKPDSSTSTQSICRDLSNLSLNSEATNSDCSSVLQVKQEIPKKPTSPLSKEPECLTKTQTKLNPANCFGEIVKPTRSNDNTDNLSNGEENVPSIIKKHRVGNSVSISDSAIDKCSNKLTESVKKCMNKTMSLDQGGPGAEHAGRPIYPNVPYSPYSSPRSTRRRTPLRESRRVSIEQSGSFLQLNQYKLMDSIGQGSYGLVKLAYSEEDSTHYAMKILSKKRLLRKAGLIGRGPTRGATSPLDRVYREIAVLKKLDHPNVVKLVEVLDDPLEDSLYLVFELVKNGEVLRVPTTTPLSEPRAWQCFRDVLLGVEYLHYQCIIHGDLKPANLLLGECGRVRVADLGVCNEFSGQDHIEATQGTPAFRAPETLVPGVYSGKAADIWSLGITLYSLVYGDVPFKDSSIPALYRIIQTKPLVFPDEPKISPELKDLISLILNKTAADRLTLPQIKQHPWITHKGTAPLPTEEENCRLVEVTEEEMEKVVTSVPKLDTLILIKTMLKKHSFQNPFTRSVGSAGSTTKTSLQHTQRAERFGRSGRSNSAPGAYHLDRQMSTENLLPSVTEGTVEPSTSSEQR